MAASVNFSSGLALNSQATLSSGTLVQGGDVFNVSLQLTYNGPMGDFTSNSTLCNDLSVSSSVVNGFITLPLMLSIVSHSLVSKSITSNLTNCTGVPDLNVTLTRDLSNCNCNIQVNASNVGWTAELHFIIKVTERVPPDSLLNITANFSIAGESKSILVAYYRSYPMHLSIVPITTSVAETTLLQLTTEEKVTFKVKIRLPSVTADMRLVVTLPAFDGKTPMSFENTVVSFIAIGVTSSILNVGSTSTYSVGSAYALTAFSTISNIATFTFGKTVSMKPLANSSDIELILKAKVSTLGIYTPDSKANISTELIYQTPHGPKTVGPELLELELTEPLLEVTFGLVDGQLFYEGKDEIVINYKVANPSFASAPARNVSVDAVAPLDKVYVKNATVMLCDAIKCMVHGSSGVNATINSLNASSELRGNLTIVLKPTVIVGSLLTNMLYVTYYRPHWNPIIRSQGITIVIKKITYTVPHAITSTVASPNDHAVITPGEEFTFEFRMILPISRSKTFVLLIKGTSVKVIRGSVKHVGANIVSESGSKLVAGSALNITSGSIPGTAVTVTDDAATGQFGVVANTGNSSVPDDNCITFQATIRAGNASALSGISHLSVSLQSYIENDPLAQEYSFHLEVVYPILSLTDVASPNMRVTADQYVDFTFTLSHTILSKAHAYRVLLEIAVPHQYLELDVGSVSPVGSVQVVNGDHTVSGSPRYNSLQTKVIIYQANEIRVDTGAQLVVRFRARTSSSIPSSIYISCPTYLYWTILPASLAPHTGWIYSYEADQGAFLTIRPKEYVEFLNTADRPTLDAGDRVEYAIKINNTGSDGNTYTAYDFKITVTFGHLDMSRTTFVCDRGSVAISGIIGELVIGDLLNKQAFSCNITGIVVDDVVPKEVISPVVRYKYYSRHSGSRPAGVAAYNFTSIANVRVATVTANISGSSNVDSMLAGEQFSYTISLGIPECVTTFKIRIGLPVVDYSGTRFAARRRRSVMGYDDQVGVSARSSRVRRSNHVIYVLEPLLNESSIALGPNSTLILTHPSPNITVIDNTTLEIDFGTVQHQATPGTVTQDVVLYLKFRSVYRPMVLSGRTLSVPLQLLFNGTSDVATPRFTIVGPLFKPLLTITKDVEIYDTNRDSPLLLYNVTVTHAPGSSYDAYDVEVRDVTQNMEIQRASVRPVSGVMVTYPAKYNHHVTLSIPKLPVGGKAILTFTASFIIKVKDQMSVSLPATVYWKSIQLNSPRYEKESNLTACATRVDESKYKSKEVTGYFALGILLGLVIGIVVAIVIIVLIIKCCDKGRIATWYTRFTNKKSMTVLTGGSQYIFQGGGDGDGPETKLVARHNESSMVQTDESIIPILTLDSATQTEKELDSLDVQATVALDADLEIQRQNMFLQLMSLLAKKLRVKRDISSSEEKSFVSKVRSEIAGVGHKLAAEFKRRSAEIQRRLQKQFKIDLSDITKRHSKEIKETEAKLKGLVSQKERRNIIDMLRKRHDKEVQDLRKKSKLDEDVEMEKLRKEIVVSKRFAIKETQSKLLQDLIKDAKLNEQQASALVREHLANMAAVDKAMDEEKSRRTVALEMRLAERRALARQKHDESELNATLVKSLEEQHEETLDELVRESKISEAEAAAYMERYKKEVNALNKKLDKEKQKQDNNLHKRLTALKQKRLEDKNREHQTSLRKFNEEQSDKYEEVEIDCIASIEERHKILEQQRQEREEMEREADKEAAEELEKSDEAHNKLIQEQAKASLKKVYQDMASKGLVEAEKNAIFDKHVGEMTRQKEAREEEREKNAGVLQKRLSKLRKNLEKKADVENEEHAVLRKKEEQIVNDLIVNQVVMSEEERDRIIEEHEKNMAELETSLTFNKLRQRQKLEEKLAAKRRRRMEELERTQQEEELVVRENPDKILEDGEDVELLKKHELEKISLLKEDTDSGFDEELDQVREDMMKERSQQLEEHQENLSATIAKLQIEKAKQLSQMAMQQQLLGQLQTNLVDELEEQGVFSDPETQKIVDVYKKDTRKLETAMKNQRQKQEEVLRERLQKKMKEREEKLLLEQKNIFSQYDVEDGVSKTTMRFRKAAVRARQQKDINELKERIDKEIEQSLNELRLGQELAKMKAIEEQNLKFISVLVSKGQLKEEEIESVLKFMFPTRSSEYIEGLLVKIFGPTHVASTTSFPKGDIGNFERRVRRTSLKPIAFIANRKNRKKKKKDRARQEDQESGLPPVVVRGGKRSNRRNDSLPPLDNDTRRGYRDDEEDSPQSSGASLPFPRRSSQSFSPAESADDKRLLDEMFGDGSEGEVTRPPGKKKKKRKK